MATTTVVAWIGAISGLTGLAWDFYKWKTSGPKLSVSVAPGMKILERGRSGMVQDNETYVAIRIRNTGTATTTITTLGLSTFESWWSRRRLKRTACGICLSPQTSQPLPHKLGVGEEWGGMVLQKGTFEEMRQTGKLWCEVCHSWSKRPILTRVPRATDPA